MYINPYLVKARQEDLLRAASQDRLAAQARRARPTHRRRAIAAPALRLAAIRLRRLFS